MIHIICLHTLIFTEWVPEPVMRLDTGWSLLFFLGLYFIFNISDVLFASLKSIKVIFIALHNKINIKKTRVDLLLEIERNKPVKVDKSIQVEILSEESSSIEE